MKRLIVAVVFLALSGIAAFAYGGGGVFSGEQVMVEPYNNIGFPLETHGGYGYGVDRRGIRTGGFGMVVFSEDYDALAGAFGGFVTGAQQRIGPFTASINLWTGFGYINSAMIEIPGYAGFIAEANGEVGFALLPWLQLSIYAGMQALGGFDMTDLLTQVRYAPVIGSRVTWGSF